MNHRLRAALAAVETRFPTGPPTDTERERIATEVGLPPNWGRRLSGASLDELMADAEELAAAVTEDEPVADDKASMTEARQIAATISTGRTGFAILTGPGRGDTSEAVERMNAIWAAANPQ